MPSTRFIVVSCIVLVFIGLIIALFAISVPPRSAKLEDVLTMVNGCREFTNVGDSTRQAVSIQKIAHTGDSSPIDSAYFQWRWQSGPKAHDSALGQGEAILFYSKEEQSRWHLCEIEMPRNGKGSEPLCRSEPKPYN